jgi:hypothetical protein
VTTTKKGGEGEGKAFYVRCKSVQTVGNKLAAQTCKNKPTISNYLILTKEPKTRQWRKENLFKKQC